DWRNSAKKYVKDMREKASKAAEEGGKSNVDEEGLGLIDRKAEKSGFFTDIRLVVVSDTKFAADEHLTNILSSFDQFTKETGNKFKKSKNTKSFVNDFI